MKKRDLILAFDTSTPCCSVALTTGNLKHGSVVASMTLNSGITHSRHLLKAIDWLMTETAIGRPEISAVAVGLGPGSFTGLRIGLATAKGLVHGWKIPLIGISSLDAIGRTIAAEALVCVVLDARKKEVYSCFYRRRKEGTVDRCSEEIVAAPAKLADSINEPVVMAGDGVDAFQAVWREKLGGHMSTAGYQYRYPHAESIGLQASEKLEAGEFIDVAQAVPTYVRASDAELSLIAHNVTTIGH